MARYVIPGRPIAYPRPAQGRKGRYMPDPYRTWKEVAQGELLQQRMPGRIMRGPVAVEVTLTPEKIFVATYSFEDSRPGKLSGDVDNYLKATMDAMQDTVFENDKQVVYATVSFE